jgi:hypothetical protein
LRVEYTRELVTGKTWRKLESSCKIVRFLLKKTGMNTAKEPLRTGTILSATNSVVLFHLWDL